MIREKKEEIGLAIVGCGTIGRIRGELARDYPGIGWIGLCDLKSDIGEALKKDCNADYFTTDYRELLARLCYPTANPNLNYEFAKGYYSRVSDRLYGRVTRLFMTPILRAMKSILGSLPLLEYLDHRGITRRQGDGRVKGPSV